MGSLTSAERITVEDALMHPYLEPYHDVRCDRQGQLTSQPEDEPTADRLPVEFFSFDSTPLGKEELKSACGASCGACPDRLTPTELIWDEIVQGPTGSGVQPCGPAPSGSKASGAPTASGSAPMEI